ncbi:MAG: TOBE domain-containing protein, partial [Pseudomonadota bacterium]|nr:TOBE domain-containing protein [Pseudomonadota bacterium]
ALRVNMRLEISQLHKDLQTTMIYVTHDQVEAMTMADKIVVFNAGNIEQVGSPMALYRHPVNKFVAGFIGSPKMNFIDVDDTVNGQPVTCLGVRPEHLVLSSTSGTWKGKVGVAEHLGSDTFLHVNVPGVANLTVRADGNCPYNYGDDVFVSPVSGQEHYFDASGKAIRKESAGNPSATVTAISQ